MSRELFGGMAMFYVLTSGSGGGALTPPVTAIGADPQIYFGTVADTGGYLSNDAAAGTVLADGAYYTGTQWMAKDTAAVSLQMTSAVPGFLFNVDTGLTPGVAFSPTAIITYLGFGSNVAFTAGGTWSPPAYTGLTASTEKIDLDFATNRTVQFATGALALQRASLFRAPTYGFVGASTLANAATLAVDGPPVAGVNATITKAWSATFGTVAATTTTASANAVGIFGAGVTNLVMRNTSNNVEVVLSSNVTIGLIGTQTAHGFNLYTSGVSRAAIDSAGKWSLTPGNTTAGITADWVLTPNTATGITANTESNVWRIGTATRTWATTGTVALQRDVLFSALTYASAGASQTFTDAATVAIGGAPIAGANAVITRAYALMVQAGDVQLAGSGSALATNATTGFPHIPTCAGTPTGVPAALKTGAAPMVFDTTGSKIWIYIGGAWKGVVVA